MATAFWVSSLIVGMGAWPASAWAMASLPGADIAEPARAAERIFPLDKSQSIHDSLRVLSGANQGLKPEDLKLDFDFPLVYHPRVEFWLRYFTTGEGREIFARWLARSGRYETMIRQILRQEGLPEDLLYLAMIESGFNPSAYSRARAAGVWQFMPSTGRRYGLSSDWWADERRDPEKSTWAAVRYLHELYIRFGRWHLAAASYNAGEGKIQRAIDTFETEDYWELLDYPFLRNETKDYLPKMIAAAIIAKNPERFGFTDVTLEPPLEYDTVKVPDATDLRVIARCAGTTFQELLRLNPDLLRWCTPPGRSWEVHVPKGTADAFQLAFAELPRSERLTFRRHLVRPGETLSQVARSYHTSASVIMQMNGIKNVHKLRAGQALIIPVPAGAAPPVVAEVERTPARKTAHRKTYAAAPAAKGAKKMSYTIQSGDTLWAISQAYGVSVQQLKAWNGIRNHYYLKPGETITLYSTQTRPVAVVAAEPSSRSKSPAGPAKNAGKNSASGKKPQGRATSYTVRNGDNLWSIAHRYRLQPEDIRTWNSLEQDHVLHPGDRLQLFLPGKR